MFAEKGGMSSLLSTPRSPQFQGIIDPDSRQRRGSQSHTSSIELEARRRRESEFSDGQNGPGLRRQRNTKNNSPHSTSIYGGENDPLPIFADNAGRTSTPPELRAMGGHRVSLGMGGSQSVNNSPSQQPPPLHHFSLVNSRTSSPRQRSNRGDNVTRSAIISPRIRMVMNNRETAQQQRKSLPLPEGGRVKERIDSPLDSHDFKNNREEQSSLSQNEMTDFQPRQERPNALILDQHHEQSYARGDHTNRPTMH